jgi:hypothetical protein
VLNLAAAGNRFFRAPQAQFSPLDEAEMSPEQDGNQIQTKLNSNKMKTHT